MGTGNADPARGSSISSYLRWLDRLKGVALIWIFLNHAAEQMMGCEGFGNPHPGWPPASELFRQLAPLEGWGAWNVPLNLFRWVGWLGDQGVGLFLVLSGFGLAWGTLAAGKPGPFRWKEFYARRLLRLYPPWIAVHGLVLVAAMLGRLNHPLSPTRFLLSVAGLRVDPDTFYAFSAGWWFVGLLLQLYLFFPVLWILSNRWGAVRLFLVSVVLAVAARGAGLAFLTQAMDPWVRGSCFITRLPEFVFGIGLAVLMHHDRQAVDRALRSAPCRFGALAVYGAGTLASFTWTGMTVAPLLTSAGSFGLLYPLIARADRNPRLGILEWVGLHTYSFFLIHSPAFQHILRYDTGPTRTGFLRLAAALAVTVAGGLGLEWGLKRIERGLTGWKERPAAQRLQGSG